jgi:hypothetical protein
VSDLVASFERITAHTPSKPRSLESASFRARNSQHTRSDSEIDTASKITAQDGRHEEDEVDESVIASDVPASRSLNSAVYNGADPSTYRLVVSQLLYDLGYTLPVHRQSRRKQSRRSRRPP